MADNIIVVDNVSMEFQLYTEKVDSIKEYLIKRLKKQIQKEYFLALDGVSFQVKRGEAVGLIGKNGSGKSTMLKTIAGVLKPTKGAVAVNGTVAPMIELGAGFDFDLTARENVFLNGAILGYPQEMLKEKFDEIISFAELEAFVDVPVKNFSSGMITRLGFAIATSFVPDILICDEILAVGDFAFQEKCEKRISDMLEKGTTLLLVSHSTDQVKRMCSKAVWLSKGKVVMDGDANTVCDEYLKS